MPRTTRTRRRRPRPNRKLGGRNDIRIITVNIGGARAQFTEALRLDAHILLIQETRLTGAQLESWRLEASMAGWEGVWEQAKPGDGNVGSGGLATLGRKGLTLGRCNVKNHHRLLKTYVQWTHRTKFHVYNIYAYDSGTPDSQVKNADLTHQLEQWTMEAGRIPWVCGGDWNRSPNEQAGGHWRNVHVHEPTRATYPKTNSTLDYFTSSIAWGPFLRTQVRSTLGGDHLPVELHIPAYDDIELGYKLHEVDPLHFDKIFRREHS